MMKLDTNSNLNLLQSMYQCENGISINLEEGTVYGISGYNIYSVKEKSMTKK